MLSSLSLFANENAHNNEPKMRKIQPWENELLATTCGKISFHETLNYPWAVSITLNGRNKLGGVIISPYHILTAAHPFVNFNGYSFIPCKTNNYRSVTEILNRKILFGGQCIRGFTASMTNHPMCKKADVLENKIRTVIIDNNFISENCTKGHDWAIIEVEEPFIFTDKVRPICLPLKNEKLRNILMIFGWGRKHSFDDGSPLIHETPMQLDVHCRATWSDNMPTNVNDYICMKSLNPKYYDTPRTCYVRGDSGSGMQQINDNGLAIVVGITSYGLKGCPPNELARFTRVDCYLNEICHITGNCISIPAYAKEGTEHQSHYKRCFSVRRLEDHIGRRLDNSERLIVSRTKCSRKEHLLAEVISHQRRPF
ncbi:BMA-TRY-4, isoform c [Dirofilaria immitis]|nr:BMA-TRY-4, isoform c [Dirofilaria immitis]